MGPTNTVAASAVLLSDFVLASQQAGQRATLWRQAYPIGQRQYSGILPQPTSPRPERARKLPLIQHADCRTQWSTDRRNRGSARFLSQNEMWDATTSAARQTSDTRPRPIPRQGGTDWRNAVRNLRSMEYRYPLRAGAGDMTEEQAALILECEKRNYGPNPPIMYLRREGGVLRETQAPDWAVDSVPVEASTNGSRSFDVVV